MKLNEVELIKTSGGLSVSATLINAFARGINTAIDLGRIIGSAISMIVFKRKC